VPEEEGYHPSLYMDQDLDLLDASIDDWLVEECGEAYEMIIKYKSGVPLARPSVGADGRKPSQFVWPSPTKMWRRVVVEEETVSGAWEVVSISCDCGRKEGTGRDCRHVFKGLEAVHCHKYHSRWVHSRWLQPLCRAG
jgi:hypothetical protein